MKKEELKELMECNFEHAKRLLSRDGKLFPVALMFCGNEMGILPLSFKGDNEKDMAVATLRALAEKKNADAVCVIAESWCVTADTITVAPSKHPMRQECIVITGECENGKVTIIQTFKRENGKIVFGEKTYMDKPHINRFSFGIEDRKYRVAPLN